MINHVSDVHALQIRIFDIKRFDGLCPSHMFFNNSCHVVEDFFVFAIHFEMVWTSYRGIYDLIERVKADGFVAFVCEATQKDTTRS